MAIAKGKIKVTLHIDVEAQQILRNEAPHDRAQGEFVSWLIKDFEKRQSQATAMKLKRQATDMRPSRYIYRLQCLLGHPEWLRGVTSSDRVC
jgi:hypothetical protein